MPEQIIIDYARPVLEATVSNLNLYQIKAILINASIEKNNGSNVGCREHASETSTMNDVGNGSSSGCMWITSTDAHDKLGGGTR